MDAIPIINQIPTDIRLTISRFLIAIAVIFIVWLLRRVIALFFVSPVRRLVTRSSTDADDVVLEAVDGAITYLIMGLGLLIGTAIIGLGGNVAQVGLRLGLSLMVFAAFKFFFDLIIYIMRTVNRINRILPVKIERELLPIARFSTLSLVAIVGLFAVANVWGINLTGLLTGIGLGGLAISLAAKEVLDDVFGYMVIMADNPFTIDEYIVSPHAEGTVEHIGVRSTHIRRLDQALTVVPNAKLVSDEVTNWSRLDRRWFNFMLGITYDTPVERIEDFTSRVREMLKNREAVDKDTVVVLFTEYDDSSLNLLVRAYVNIADWTEANAERHAVNLEIMQIANEMDVAMAFPSRSLYLEQMPPVATVDKRQQQAQSTHEAGERPAPEQNTAAAYAQSDDAPGGDGDW